MNVKCLNIFIICLFFLCDTPIFSQEKFHLNIEVGYPAPGEKFFIFYKGVIATNIGVGYKLTGTLYSGFSFSYLYTRQNNPEVSAMYYIPSLNLKYKQKLPFRFFVLPEAGVGLIFINLKCSVYDYYDTQKGGNLYGKLALGYPVFSLFDILVYYRYDYLHLKKDEEFTKLEYFRNLHITNFGIGINIKLPNK